MGRQDPGIGRIMAVQYTSPWVEFFLAENDQMLIIHGAKLMYSYEENELN